MLSARFFSAITVLIASLLLTVTVSHAGTELRFRNGDRLSGELIKREDGKIYFKSPVLGEITIPQSEAVVVEAPDTPVESLVGLPPAPAEKPPQAVKPAPSSAPGAPATAQTSAPSKPAGKTSRWKGKLEFGYQQQTGRRETINTSLRLDADKTAGPDSLKGTGRVLYGRNNHKASTERYDASFRWRHQYTKRIFGQSLTSYNSDRIKDIDLNFEQNISLGYRLLNRPRHLLNAGLGVTGQKREADGIKNDPIALGEVFQDYTYRFNGRLTLVQDSSVVYSNRDVINNGVGVPNYRIRFNTALQGRVTERVSLNIRYEYEWDNTAPDIAEKRDQRITSSIGYAL